MTKWSKKIIWQHMNISRWHLALCHSRHDRQNGFDCFVWCHLHFLSWAVPYLYKKCCHRHQFHCSSSWRNAGSICKPTGNIVGLNCFKLNTIKCLNSYRLTTGARCHCSWLVCSPFLVVWCLCCCLRPWTENCQRQLRMVKSLAGMLMKW